GTPTIADSGQPARVAVGGSRSGIGNDRPTLASAEAIAGMIRKSVPGIGGSPEARMAESLSMRTSEARREAARTLGGSPESEDAVERGLAWLASTQSPDGHWSIRGFPGDATFQADSAATGLALLAYLGAGYTHQSGKYQHVVDRGVKWLLEHQKPNGDLFADELEFVWLYSHGMASIALCEAYGMTKDPELKGPAQRALNFIIASQHPEFGGWRYRPGFESDTSVSGWQLMALKSGEMSGLVVPKKTYAGVSKWLDSVQSKKDIGQFSYHPAKEVSPTMTAEGLLMRQYLGAKRNDAQLIAGANFLQTRLPDFGQRDSYYWYYATQVMFHMQGEHWNAWNSNLRDTLVESQTKDGAFSGSWDPARPTPEKWANSGGRHYVTCLNLLMLEVYYRHLPLYLELEK
ncbi:MAG: terpene cyclase/mutase family protein, partial [Planctomycetota bacterium]|nr:terpene cyclase/mutase family protein [Planctomycetota bacterium]